MDLGICQCDLADLSYKGSFRASNIDISVFNNYLPQVITGNVIIRGDFKGQGVEFENLDSVVD